MGAVAIFALVVAMVNLVRLWVLVSWSVVAAMADLALVRAKVDLAQVLELAM